MRRFNESWYTLPDDTVQYRLCRTVRGNDAGADSSGNIVLRSRAADEDMVCPKNGLQIIRPDGIRISSAPISGGYAVWQDNVRPLTELRARLSENKAKIRSNKEKLQEAYLIQKKLNELTEKNRIYDDLETKYGER